MLDGQRVEPFEQRVGIGVRPQRPRVGSRGAAKAATIPRTTCQLADTLARATSSESSGRTRRTAAGAVTAWQNAIGASDRAASTRAAAPISSSRAMSGTVDAGPHASNPDSNPSRRTRPAAARRPPDRRRARPDRAGADRRSRRRRRAGRRGRDDREAVGSWPPRSARPWASSSTSIGSGPSPAGAARGRRGRSGSRRGSRWRRARAAGAATTAAGALARACRRRRGADRRSSRRTGVRHRGARASLRLDTADRFRGRGEPGAIRVHPARYDVHGPDPHQRLGGHRAVVGEEPVELGSGSAQPIQGVQQDVVAGHPLSVRRAAEDMSVGHDQVTIGDDGIADAFFVGRWGQPGVIRAVYRPLYRRRNS